MSDGAKAAEISNVALATAMGVQRGATVGIELGFYRGVSAAWVAKGNMCEAAIVFTLHSNSLTPVPGSFLRIVTTNGEQSWSVLRYFNRIAPHAASSAAHAPLHLGPLHFLIQTFATV